MTTLDILVIEPGISKSQEIQAAIDKLHAQGGGEIWLKNGEYVIDSVLEPKNGVTIKGIRPALDFFGICPDLGFRLVGGSVLKAAADNIECFALNTSPDPAVDRGISVSISNLGFKGFRKILTAGARNSTGLGLSELRNLFIDGTNDTGTTVTELAFDLVNPQHVKMDHIKCYSVKRGLRMSANHDNCQPGNSVVIDFYAYLEFGVQPDYGILLEVVDTGVSPRALNVISFFRPQINAFGIQAPPPGSARNALIKAKGLPSAPVAGCEFYGLDAEGDTDCAVWLKYTLFTHITIAKVTQNNVGLCLESGRYTHAVSLMPDVNIEMDKESWPSTLSGFAKTPFADRQPFGYYWDETNRSTRLQFDQRDYRWTHKENSGTIKPKDLGLADQVISREFGGSLSPNNAGTVQVPNLTPVTFTLPDATLCTGISYTFVKTTANTQPISIQGRGGQTINGQLINSDLDSAYKSLMLRSVGTEWVII